MNSVKHLFDAALGVGVQAVHDGLSVGELLRGARVRSRGLHRLADHDDRKQNELQPTRESIVEALHDFDGQSTALVRFAEHSGEIIKMGKWVLEQAARDRHHWQRQLAEEIAISVNVSAHQFMAAGFANTVASVLDTASTDPRLLILEVTENVFVREGDRTLIVLNELKDIGVKLALDDFGTGYSSLSYLNTLPIDTIKIDQSFITNLGADLASHTVLAAIIQLAHGLGMTVVSEGVETAEQQQQQLTELGSDACQGFYFAYPMGASSLDILIQHQANESNPHLPSLASEKPQCD